MMEYKLQVDNNHNMKQNTLHHYSEKNFETLNTIEQLKFCYVLKLMLVSLSPELHWLL